jgi:hypothetical protein
MRATLGREGEVRGGSFWHGTGLSICGRGVMTAGGGIVVLGKPKASIALVGLNSTLVAAKH